MRTGSRATSLPDLSGDAKNWKHLLSDTDAILHCAGHRGPGTTWAEARSQNLDMSLRLMITAERMKVRRFVFLSSNWVMAGYRFGEGSISTELPPYPINPYGMAKLAIERAGLAFGELGVFEFIALRIGMVVVGFDDTEARLAECRRWSQEMWLSQVDFCHGIERALVAPLDRPAVVNLMSDNPGMRWDIETTKKMIGYEPKDGRSAVVRPDLDQMEATFARHNDRRAGIVELLTGDSTFVPKPIE
ncbi:NAD-dependent epimerase/dehydratase family protein [Rhodobacterales bacterium HKCCE2091]|nr:NAD-dependent epimerase/dehydratase family protein [Rhodobacterales bacterium HKCCE2091]